MLQRAVLSFGWLPNDNNIDVIVSCLATWQTCDVNNIGKQVQRTPAITNTPQHKTKTIDPYV